MTGGRRFPREFLLAELRRVARLVGGIPTMSDFDRESQVAAVTVEKRFRGWNKALESAGFDPSMAKYTFSDLELLDELRRVAAKIGRTPTTTEFREHSETGASTIAQRFGGTWAKACTAAGLLPVPRRLPKPVAGWNKGQRKSTINAEDLRYLYEQEGLSAPAIGRRIGVSRTTVLRMLRENGIEIKRLHYSMPRATGIEEAIYLELERRQVPFARQQVIDGLYVADALILGARIVIECDGEYWHGREGAAKRDARRDRYLQSRGYRVLRFPEVAIRADVAACAQRVVDELVSTYGRSPVPPPGNAPGESPRRMEAEGTTADRPLGERGADAGDPQRTDEDPEPMPTSQPTGARGAKREQR